MVFVMVPFAASLVGVLMFIEHLNSYSFIGFPLGYFLLAQGSIIVSFLGFVWHGYEQDRIDRHHGTHEDV